jgi:cytochrome c oxidase subunit IV
MRVETTLWVAVTVYFALITLIYAAVGGEAAGGALLTIAVGFGGLVAGWTWRYRRRSVGERPSDRTDADIADDAGVVGELPAASLRPLGLAVGMAAIVLGVPLGWWMILAGVAIVASQVALLVRDADS